LLATNVAAAMEILSMMTDTRIVLHVESPKEKAAEKITSVDEKKQQGNNQ
jgi:hypothetical protein